MLTRSIALVGDCDPEVTAHRAIPLVVELASRETEPTGTQFQPERSALAGRNHPLVTAFVAAVRSCNTDHPVPRRKDARLDQEAQQIL
jgi:hypothetical protein